MIFKNMPRGVFRTSLKKRQKLPFSKIMRLHIYVVVTDAKWESGNFLRIKRPTKSLEGPFSSAAAKKIWNKY